MLADRDSTARPRELYDDISLTNGIGLSPDGTVLYHSDTPRGVWAHDYDDGTVANRRLFVPIDAVCPRRAGGGRGGHGVGGRRLRLRAVRGFSPAGEEVGRVEVPARMVTSVCFGGADRRDMYIVTGDNTEDRDRRGTIYRTRADVPGVRGRGGSRLSRGSGRGTARRDATDTDLFDDVARWQADAAQALGLQGVEFVAALSPGPGFPGMLDALAERIVAGGAHEVVDLGAGLGGVSAWIAAATGATVVGVEPESGSRDAAHRLFPGLDVRAGSAADSGLDAASADVVVAVGLTSLLDTVDGLFAEAGGSCALAASSRSSTCSFPTAPPRSTARTRCARALRCSASPATQDGNDPAPLGSPTALRPRSGSPPRRA